MRRQEQVVLEPELLSELRVRMCRGISLLLGSRSRRG